MNQTTRRPLLVSLACAGMLMGTAGTSHAQGSDFPSKPVTLYTAFAVGSGPDAVLRLVAHKLSTSGNRP